MSKLEEVTKVAATKVSALYSSGNETQIAVFEQLCREKAEARGESPQQAESFLDMLKGLGATLSGGGVSSMAHDSPNHVPPSVVSKKREFYP